MAGAVAVLSALLTWPLIQKWRRLRSPGNWTLVVHADGLWLNLRRADHADEPPGETIAFLPYADIDAARMHTHRYRRRGSDGGMVSRKDRCLDFGVSQETSQRLQEALERDGDERVKLLGEYAHDSRCLPPRPGRSPFITPAPGLIRFEAELSGSYARPRLGRIHEVIGEHVRIDPPTIRDDR